LPVQGALAIGASVTECVSRVRDGNGKPAKEARLRTWSEQPDPEGHAQNQFGNLEIWKFGNWADAFNASPKLNGFENNVLIFQCANVLILITAFQLLMELNRNIKWFVKTRTLAAEMGLTR